VERETAYRRRPVTPRGRAIASKTNGSPEWTRWSPFTGAPFISADPKTITDFEVSAEIVVRKGPMDDADPLAFEAWALSDLLVNQVSPPK
jgi:hypothetical protein